MSSKAQSLLDSLSALSPEELAVYPAAAPPPGTESTFGGLSSWGQLYIGLASFLLFVVIVFVCLRLYAKAIVMRSPGWDDLCCILAAIGQTAWTGIVIYECVHGVGKPMWDVHIFNLPGIINLGLVGAIVQEPTIFFTKISLLLLYYRLFAPDKGTKIAIFVGAVLIFSAYTIMMFLYIFLPYQDQLLVSEAVGAFNVVSDIYLLCLPIAAVSRLQLPWRKKLGVSAIFLTGLLAVIMSIVGLVYRVEYTTSDNSNLTLDLWPVNTVSTVEVDIGILCTCMPFFPALVKNSKAIQRMTTSMRSLRSRAMRSSNQTSEQHTGNSASKPKNYPVYSGTKDRYIELGEVERSMKRGGDVQGAGKHAFRHDLESGLRTGW